MFRAYFVIPLLGMCCFCLVSADISLAASKQVNLKPGLWEITTEMKMEGLPYTIPPVTHTTCMTEDDLVPKQNMGQAENECTIEFEIVDNNTVVWESACPSDEGQITSKGKTTYSGTTFAGEMTTEIPNAGMSRQVMTGRRIGPCP